MARAISTLLEFVISTWRGYSRIVCAVSKALEFVISARVDIPEKCAWLAHFLSL